MFRATSRGRGAFAALASLATFTVSCSQQQQPLGYACPAIEPVIVVPALAYPLPGATKVPDDVGILVAFNDDTTTLIRLVTSAAAPIDAISIPVPTPLPSPIATPYSPSQPYFARRIPVLMHATTYTVQAYYSVGGGTGPCAAPLQTGYSTFATFTTQ